MLNTNLANLNIPYTNESEAETGTDSTPVPDQSSGDFALPDAACYMASISGLGGSICDYLLDKGIELVSIYGVDQIAAMVWEQVCHADIQISRTVSDRNRNLRVILPRAGTIKFEPLGDVVDINIDAPVIVCTPLNNKLRQALLEIGKTILELHDLMYYAYCKRSLFDIMENLARNNPRTKFILYNHMRLFDVTKTSAHRELILSMYKQESPQAKMAVSEHIYKTLGYSQEYCTQCRRGINVELKGKVPFVSEYRSTYVNCVNGYRLTTDIPENADRTIYMFGNSTVYGLGVDDAGTIPSVLQRELNGYYHGKSPYSVLNCANGGALNTLNMAKSLQYHSYLENDIVICGFGLNRLQMEIYKDRFIICDSASYINNLQNLDEYGFHGFDQFFLDKFHMNPYGHRECARAIINTLETNGLLEMVGTGGSNTPSGDSTAVPGPQSALSLSPDETEQLEAYLDGLKPLAAHATGKTGSIVMNCNPFTLGHRYLIEYAAFRVDWLFIFVVEEDRSVFPFPDRLYLVKEGVKDLENVTVIPSGKFIISQTTFAAYFKKETQKNVVIDASADVTIFAEKIAPVLHIVSRFAGEEPLDPVTRQYNSTMKRILPRYGIEFESIPRKESNGEPISASRVRRLIENKRFEEISHIVPQTTFEYLLEKYGNQ